VRRFFKWIRETFFGVEPGAPWCEEPPNHEHLEDAIGYMTGYKNKKETNDGKY
jgi:hypothetical protein